MQSVPIGQYRSHDTPKNFAIKVNFWKVTAGSVIPSARFPSSNNPELAQDALELVDLEKFEEEKEELVIHWQEKFFSQEEFEFFGDSINCIDAPQIKYHEDIELIKRAGDRPNKRIFTYIDSDSFTIRDDLDTATTNDDQPPNLLTEKMSKTVHRNIGRRGIRNGNNVVVNEPTENMKLNHVITTPHKSMYIMADLSYAIDEGAVIKDERVICKLTIDANGLIVLRPDLDTGEVFTMEAYEKKRQLYNYTLHHVSMQMSSAEVEQELSLFDELYTRHAQQMALQVGTELYPVPRKTDLFVYSFVEIISAKDFEYSDLYVKYLLDLPAGWQSDSKQLSGVTQSCSMNANGVAHFSFPIDFHLLYVCSEETPEDFIKWPTLYLQVFSLDSWQRHRIEGYGYCCLPDVAGSISIKIQTWRPKGDSAFSEMNRFFIGGSPELQDLSYVKIPSAETMPGNHLSKFYFKTVTTGSVILKLQTMFQTRIPDNLTSSKKIPSKWKKTLHRNSGFSSVADSLTKALGAFQHARKRMLAARSNLPVMM